MREIPPQKVRSTIHDGIREREIEQIAQSMIKMFGPSASGKAIEMIRHQTSAGDRDGALKWHLVMSRIEESRRDPR
jgi:hypothetical protein